MVAKPYVAKKLGELNNRLKEVKKDIDTLLDECKIDYRYRDKVNIINDLILDCAIQIDSDIKQAEKTLRLIENKIDSFYLEAYLYIIKDLKDELDDEIGIFGELFLEENTKKSIDSLKDDISKLEKDSKSRQIDFKNLVKRCGNIKNNINEIASKIKNSKKTTGLKTAFKIFIFGLPYVFAIIQFAIGNKWKAPWYIFPFMFLLLITAVYILIGTQRKTKLILKQVAVPFLTFLISTALIIYIGYNVFDIGKTRTILTRSGPDFPFTLINKASYDGSTLNLLIQTQNPTTDESRINSIKISCINGSQIDVPSQIEIPPKSQSIKNLGFPLENVGNGCELKFFISNEKSNFEITTNFNKEESGNLSPSTSFLVRVTNR